MKLNNKGWGTLQMVLLCLGLFLALLVAIFFISKLYGSFDKSIHNKEYSDMQANLESAARRYVIFNNITIDGELKISADTLYEVGYIDLLKDSSGNSCDGYVRVRKVDLIDYYNAFITCPNYQTNNY